MFQHILVYFQAQGLVRPASPRAAFIKKLQQIKEAKANNAQKQSLVRHSNKPLAQAQTKISEKTDESGKVTTRKTVSDRGDNAKSTVSGKGGNNSDDDESDSSEDVYSDDSDDGDDETGDEKGSGDRRGLKHSSHFSNKVSSYPVNPFHMDIGQNKETSKNDSVCSTDKKLARVLSYTAMTEASSQSSESEQDSDSDEDSTGSEEEVVVNESPSKVVTRKIASKPNGQKLTENQEYLTAGFDSSAFIPNSKSPLVISKEKVGTVDALKDEAKFSYHSDSDSVGNRKNDSFSESEEDKCGDKNTKFSEKKTLQFDDDDEWTDSTPKPQKSCKHRVSDAGENEHDRTLVEDPDNFRHQSGKV